MLLIAWNMELANPPRTQGLYIISKNDPSEVENTIDLIGSPPKNHHITILLITFSRDFCFPRLPKLTGRWMHAAVLETVIWIATSCHVVQSYSHGELGNEANKSLLSF